MDSPICKMLAAEGTEAVDALVNVLDHDERLTRSYLFGRSSFSPERLISVAEVAEEILRSLYGIDFPRTDAAKRREWLLRNKYRTLAERAFDLLADDTNDTWLWLEGVRTLLRPNKQAPGIVGDAIRGRKDPSVSDLLSRRAIEVNSSLGGDLALLLYQWEPTAALPALRKNTRLGMRGAHWGRLYAARIALGDSAAVGEYIEAMEAHRSGALDELAPLWTAPNEEGLVILARKLFVGPGALMPLGTILASGDPWDGGFPWSLLKNSVFREGVLAALARRDVIGSVERLADGRLRMRAGNFGMERSGGGGEGRPAGKQEIRGGDYMAWRLSHLKGFPMFDLEWEVRQRDEGIARMTEYVRDHRFENGAELRSR